jgi:Ser/Thr protein kinase RdoA (MazF antagonist)
MCRGFHSIIPLEEQEVALLLDLVITRQVLILELFEFRRRNMINPPRFVTEDQPGVIASLEMLLALDRKAFNRELGRIWK